MDTVPPVIGSTLGRNPRWFLTLSFVTVIIFLLTACIPAYQGTLPDDDTGGTSDVDESIRPFYEQTVRWESCGANFECATVEAPLDWQNPSKGKTVDLALIKSPAKSSEKRLGSLFTNPGGPGGSGVDLVQNGVAMIFSAELRDHYDIIGWDPRGVGQSTPVECFADDAEKNRYLYEDFLDVKEGEPGYFDAVEELFQDLADHCERYSGELLNFVDTVSTVHDLDMLRHLVQDKSLNYLGFSYGAYLGAIYAEEFPHNVGRVVLDGPVAPETDIVGINYFQAQGFEEGLEQYLMACLRHEQGMCPFDGSVQEAKDTIIDMMHSLDDHPMTGSDGREFSGDALAMALIAGLYSEETWSFVSMMLGDVFAGDVDNGLVLIDFYNGRNPDGSFNDNSYEANLAVNCLDYPAIADPEQWAENQERVSEVAEVFGPYFGYAGGVCSKWPAQSKVERKPVTAAGSDDILVVGNVHDTATPYSWAESLADQLENGHLLTREGQGHTSYNPYARCIVAAVDGYLIEGVIPDAGTVCVE